MADKISSPIRPTDDEARALGRTLIDNARFGALGVIDPETNAPMVSRIAVGTDDTGCPVTLISDLSHHTKALRVLPSASLLLGEAGEKGDPLTHPRITLQVKADFLSRNCKAFPDLRTHYLEQHPKAKLYIDFTDFQLVHLRVTSAMLNGGFGKAFLLKPSDLNL